jgi:hypothetical protein
VADGRTDFTINAYGKNMLNKTYRYGCVDFLFSADYEFATCSYTRPRVFGLNITAKY